MPLRMLLLIFWTTMCAAQTSNPICLRPFKSEWEADSVKGRVKVVRTFRTTFGKDHRTGQPIGGKPYLEDEAKYDAQGKRTYWLKLIHSRINPDNVNSVVEYDCDGPTRIKEIRYRRAKDPSFKKTVYGYDDNKRLSERAIYFADGTLDSSEKYKYDDKGNLIEETFTQQMSHGHQPRKRNDPYVTTRKTYGYDAKQNRISETRYLIDGSPYLKLVFEYDSRKNLIKDLRTDERGRLDEQYLYKYDRHNRLVEERHYSNLCQTRDGEFCKGTVNSEDGEFYYLTRTVYEYDRKGNWVRQREFSMGGQSGSQHYQLNEILSRRFVYYQ